MVRGLACLVMLVVGCGQPTTQVMVNIYASPDIHDSVQNLHYEVWGGPIDGERELGADVTTMPFKWPWVVAIAPKGENANRVFDLRVRGETPSGSVYGRLISRFQAGRTTTLDLFLDSECTVECTGGDLVCVEGECVSDFVPDDAHRDYPDDLNGETPVPQDSGPGPMPEPGPGLSPGFTPEVIRVMGRSGGDYRIDGSYGRDCIGFVPREPQHAILINETIDSLTVTAFADDGSDLTLVVRNQSDRFRCNDDHQEGGVEPLIRRRFREGTHYVWVGSYRRGVRANYTLAVTESETFTPSEARETR